MEQHEKSRPTPDEKIITALKSKRESDEDFEDVLDDPGGSSWTTMDMNLKMSLLLMSLPL